MAKTNITIPAEGKPYGSEEIRAEHRSCVDYHTALVNSRFTIVAFYITALGFLGGTIFKKETGWSESSILAALASWITLCAWILELRSRALFTNIAHRGVQIEREYWKLDEMEGFFSRQHKLPRAPLSSSISSAEPRQADPDRPALAWARQPFSKEVSRFISHSMGCDMLYGGALSFWLATFIVSFVWAVSGR